MKTYYYKKLMAVLIIGLFIMQFVPAKPVMAAVDQTAYYNDIGKKIEDMANKYNIPPVLLKAIAWMESGWIQFKLDPTTGQPLTDQPLIGKDGIGIGIMQISSYDPKDTATMDKLKNDINYNIEVGCQMLNQKWRAYPKIGNGDRNILENWYFAVWGYNSWGSRNNPNVSTGQSAYQDSVFSLMGQDYIFSKTGIKGIITFTPKVTKMPQSLLPLVDPPNLTSRWSTPTPTHTGDLIIDANRLISTGGGSIADANGDYWYNYARWASYYALGFYVTAYDSPLVIDKTIVTQKILSCYTNLLVEADALMLKGDDSSKATAAKYYWTVLQGPSLDAGITERAKIGYDKANTNIPAPPVPTPQPVEFTRLAGMRAEDTAIKISQEGWANNSSPVVLLARVDRFQDALAAAPLAKKLKAPLLLTAPDQLDNSVLQEIQRLGSGGKVYVIGGEGAIKKTVSDSLIRANISVERIFGNTAADTAVEIAKKIGPSTQVILASSTSFPDALSASAPAAALGIPILLTEQGSLSQSTKQLLKDFQVTKTIIVGGSFAIPSILDSNNGALVNYGPLRLAGETKYDTMLKVVKYFNQDPKSLVIATGENFPDGLSGGAFAALNGSPLLLIPTKGLNVDTQTFLKSLCGKTTKTYILGGTGVICKESQDLIGSLLAQ